MNGLGGANSVCLVIPCFNEALRLPGREIERLAATPGVSLVLVDDGSTDTTLAMLRSIEADAHDVSVVPMSRNQGKGEAVRVGLIHARRQGTEWVGYLDADFATPGSEMLRLVGVAVEDPELAVVLGSRVALLGRDIRRSAFRHYTGRIFATFASMTLELPVYDTQCGAKLFRSSPSLDRAVSVPFRSRWAFDVELLGRIRRSGVEPNAFWEEPLLQWHDVRGSRRSLRSSVRSTIDLLWIMRDLSRWSAP
jgi:glycosyltransferase involved in cell wall biosynthesis